MPNEAASKDLKVGDPRLTLKLRNDYGKAQVETQMNGEPTLPKWEEWLSGLGYGLDARGNVYKTE